MIKSRYLFGHLTNVVNRDVFFIDTVNDDDVHDAFLPVIIVTFVTSPRSFEIKDNGELVLRSPGPFNGSLARLVAVASDTGKPPRYLYVSSLTLLIAVHLLTSTTVGFSQIQHDSGDCPRTEQWIIADRREGRPGLARQQRAAGRYLRRGTGSPRRRHTHSHPLYLQTVSGAPSSGVSRPIRINITII